MQLELVIFRARTSARRDPKSTMMGSTHIRFSSNLHKRCFAFSIAGGSARQISAVQQRSARECSRPVMSRVNYVFDKNQTSSREQQQQIRSPPPMCRIVDCCRLARAQIQVTAWGDVGRRAYRSKALASRSGVHPDVFPLVLGFDPCAPPRCGG